MCLSAAWKAGMLFDPVWPLCTARCHLSRKLCVCAVAWVWCGGGGGGGGAVWETKAAFTHSLQPWTYVWTQMSVFVKPDMKLALLCQLLFYVVCVMSSRAPPPPPPPRVNRDGRCSDNSQPGRGLVDDSFQNSSRTISGCQLGVWKGRAGFSWLCPEVTWLKSERYSVAIFLWVISLHVTQSWNQSLLLNHIRKSAAACRCSAESRNDHTITGQCGYLSGWDATDAYDHLHLGFLNNYAHFILWNAE